MGLSGGSTTTTQNSSSISGSAQPWAQPFAQTAAASAQGVFNANQPNLDAITRGLSGLIPGVTARYQAGSPGVRAAQDYAGRVIGGGFLNGNPYIDDIIARTRRGVIDDVNSQFSGAGRYGSGAHAGVLAQRLGEVESGLRYQDYAGERERMDRAAAMAPGLAEADFQGLREILGLSTTAGTLPYAGLEAYADALSGLFSGGTSQSTTVQKEKSGLLGALASVGSAALMGSDRRLKTGIEKIGELPDGLGWYRWTYLWGEPGEGVMADEVAQLRPWALGPVIEGFATVRTDILGGA